MPLCNFPMKCEYNFSASAAPVSHFIHDFDGKFLSHSESSGVICLWVYTIVNRVVFPNAIMSCLEISVLVRRSAFSPSVDSMMMLVSWSKSSLSESIVRSSTHFFEDVASTGCGVKVKSHKEIGGNVWDFYLKATTRAESKRTRSMPSPATIKPRP